MASFALNSRAVLFLDVDGVLAMHRCALEEYDSGDESLYFVQQLCPAITAFVTPLEKSRVAMLKVCYDLSPCYQLSVWCVLCACIVYVYCVVLTTTCTT
jgi:hypothetical protein